MNDEIREFAPSQQLIEIAEEFVQRVRDQESPTVQEYLDRYPEQASENSTAISQCCCRRVQLRQQRFTRIFRFRSTICQPVSTAITSGDLSEAVAWARFTSHKIWNWIGPLRSRFHRSRTLIPLNAFIAKHAQWRRSPIHIFVQCSMSVRSRTRTSTRRSSRNSLDALI